MKDFIFGLQNFGTLMFEGALQVIASIFFSLPTK